MDRTDIINYLIEQNQYVNYLEIGLDNPNKNYTKIKIENKESVDPYISSDHSNGFDMPINSITQKLIEENLTYRMTSDDFFKQNKKEYDIIFIDGLHTKEQVAKDIINSLKILKPNGKIVVHDCLPTQELHQKVPRQTAYWNGDVWRTIPELKNLNITFHTVDCDEGCCVIDYIDNAFNLEYVENWCYNWADYVNNKKELLNTITPTEFKLIYSNK